MSEPTAEQVYRMRYMREAQGLGLQSIASIIGFSLSTVHKHVKDLPMIRKCPVCNELYESQTSKQVYCSRQCKPRR